MTAFVDPATGQTFDYTAKCGYQSNRMKGPCDNWLGHEHTKYATPHFSRTPVNEDTPRLNEFRRIVEVGLDHGVQLTYLEIGELMNHPNLRSVANYGLGSRYTKLRQRLYEERGLKAGSFQPRSAEQSRIIIEDMREALRVST